MFMATELNAHPLRRWRKNRKYTTLDISHLLKARGVEFKRRSLLAVEDGWRRPAYDVCEIIEAITGGVVTVAELRHWPLRECATKPKVKSK